MSEDQSLQTVEINKNDDQNLAATPRDSPAVRAARFMACHPYKFFFGTLGLTLAISVLAGSAGLEVSLDSKGWRSRNTLIAQREMQNEIVVRFKDELFEDTNGTVWEELENNVVTGFVLIELREDPEAEDDGNNEDSSSRRHRQLFVEGCDENIYSTTMLAKDNLHAVYKTEASKEISTKSILERDVLLEICQAESKTHEVLQEKELCGGCDDNSKCLPPHSLVLVLRMYLNAMDSTCNELMDKYTEEIQGEFTETLEECVKEIRENYDSTTQSYGVTTKCPDLFQVNLVDKEFAKNGNSFLRYSSSYFITHEVDEQDLYDARPQYGSTDESIVTSVYDTLTETQTEIYSETLVIPDMTLALGSLTITFTAMAIHTKSMWLTMVGVMQIIFSVPLATFVYVYIAGINFFPFLNLIGVFVAAALGADYVFVSVDKWKNARLENQSVSTQEVAALALPNAASAMFLTTSTTVVAFFATMICPVAPILCFALFCGLLIMFNYIMNVLLLFPALCLYDIWLKNGSRNILTNFRCCSKPITEANVLSQSDDKQSLIHRILSKYYNYLHKLRYGVLIASIIATAVCIYIALTISLPDSADVRVLPEGNVFELHNKWKQELFSFLLFYSGGSFGQITWGVRPADTGAKNNPDSLSTLELDDTFDASSTEAQTYLLGFCDRLFDTDIAQPLNTEYLCPINEFDAWLKNQSSSTNKTEAYTNNCNNAMEIPMSENDFDNCIISWSELTKNKNILEKQGKVKIIRLRVKNGVSWDSPFAVMDEFWNRFEKFLEGERSIAPATTNKMFHTAGAYWWYDTNISMLQTAIGACIIAIIFSTVIVLISSRSVTLTIFSTICITYVLAATTSSLVGFGWSLGFLESVCFAILVGVSCDFVIHFGHAYNFLEGDASRFERTKYAVIHMGPSILAAAFTTFAAAITMLFCQITFFTKFALILLMTILHATLASFVIYLVLTDSFGPSEPTKFIDRLFLKFKSLFSKKQSNEPSYSASPVMINGTPMYDLGKNPNVDQKQDTTEPIYDLGKSHQEEKKMDKTRTTTMRDEFDGNPM